jgi:hypothetical protein
MPLALDVPYACSECDVSPLDCTTAWREALLLLDGSLTAIGKACCPVGFQKSALGSDLRDP